MIASLCWLHRPMGALPTGAVGTDFFLSLRRSGCARTWALPGGFAMDYKSPRWRRVRARVLRRDRFLCRECARYGVNAPASVVHHVWPTDDFPQWAWDERIMISLCPACHERMHERSSGALSDAGERWRRRVPPPAGAVRTAP